MSYISSAPGTPTGTATFSNGTLTWSGTGTSGSFTGTSTNKADVTFSGYGVFYTDWFGYMNLLKNPPAPPTTLDCSAIKSMYETIFGTIAKYAIVKSGSMNFDVVTSYAAATTTSTSYSSSTDYTSTVNSPGGIVLQDQSTSTPGPDQTVTLDNAKFAYSSSITISGTPTSPTGMTGNMSLTMSGKVNGVSIDQTFSISF